MIKKSLFFKCLLLFMSIVLLPNSFAQDFSQSHLPEGAKARIGNRVETIKFSPDGKHLVVVDSIGIWVYDAHTGEDLTVLTGHNTIVRSIVFSRDGKTLMSSGEDSIVRLWNVNTGKLKHALRGHQSFVRTVVLSPDGKTLVSAGYSIPSGDVTIRGGTIRLWNPSTGQLKHILTGHEGNPNNVAFSPDGKTLVSSGDWPDPIIFLWDTNTGKLRHTLTGHNGRIVDVRFSPDGKTLVSNQDGILYLWDVNTGQLKNTLTGHNSNILSVVFSSNGKTLASGGADGTIQLWNPNTGTSIRTLTGHKSFVSAVKFSPDGKTLVSFSRKENTIYLWNPNTGKLKHTLAGHKNSIRYAAFSPDGKTLVSIADRHSTIYLWNPNTGKPKHTLTEHDSTVDSVAFSPDGNTLVSHSWDGTVRLWNPNTGANIRTFMGYKRGYDAALAFSPDGNTIAGESDACIYLWDANTGTHKRTFEKRHRGVQAIAFSPDGNTIVSSGYGGLSDHQPLLWDANTGKLKQKLSGEFGRYRIGKNGFPNLIFSPDGNTIFGSDGHVYLWDANTGEVKQKLTGHKYRIRDIALSPDGSTIAGGGTNDLRLWNAKTGKFKQRFTGHTHWVDSVAFSPDGNTIASGSRDNTLRLWDANTGKLKLPPIEHTNWGGSVAFSPDGNTIASSGFNYNNVPVDGTVYLWDAKTGKLKRKLTGHASWVRDLIFSPDGSTLASASQRDGTTLLWEIAPVKQVLVAASQRPPMYWVNTQTGTLHRLVGAKIENLAPSVKNATNLVVDTTNGKLYWTTQVNSRHGKIQRANLDGSNVQLVKNLTRVPLDIALDTTNGNLYLTNSWGKLQRLNLDGSDFQPNLITGLQSPNHLALDVQRGKVYWTEQTDDSTGKVRSANLDGSDVQLVKELTSPPQGIAVDVVNKKLYLTSASGHIQRMTLVGSYFRPNLITGLGSLGEISVDTAGRKLYWTESGRIRRANFNGKNIQDIVTRIGTPADIALGVMSAQVAAAPATTAAPEQTLLLSNYPNPFNPETWIPYQLAAPSEVRVTIYDTRGIVVRRLALGHQPAGFYTSRSRAAYWDGRNSVGERVASGIYFYQLETDEISSMRKMVILK
ncbi:MAG: PQQ-binding-like beta-propeller repeat protein [Candidatus Poribacteria bacterium]|nr:PQQ-binding-like beta-propeller repeat protein [Candidatus Poribacteria bacterium]